MPRSVEDFEVDNINLLALQHDYTGARSALMKASQSPSYLSEAVNERSKYGYSLLHSVVEFHPLYGEVSAQQRKDQIEFLEHLLNIQGVDPNVKDQMGYVPLARAMYSFNAEAMQVLVDHGAKWDPDGETPVSFSYHVPRPRMSPEQQNEWNSDMDKMVAIAKTTFTTKLCSAGTLSKWLW